MSEIVRILEIMNYRVGSPINEQKNILFESYTPKFEGIFDIIKNIHPSISRVGSSLPNFSALESKLNNLFPGKSFNDQMDGLLNKIKSAGPGFGAITEKDAKLLDELLESAWIEIVGYVDNLPKLGDRMSWWSQINDDSKLVLDIQQQVNSILSSGRKVDPQNTQTIISDLKTSKNKLSSFVETWPFGKMTNDTIKVIDEITMKLLPKEESTWKNDLVEFLDIGDAISVLRRWYDVFSKTPLRGASEELATSDITSYQKLAEEIKKLSDEISLELDRPSAMGMSAENEAKVRRLSELIFAFKRDWNGQERQLIDTLKQEGYITDNLYNHIINKQKNNEYFILNDWIDTVEKLRNSGDKKAQDIVKKPGWKSFQDEFTAYGEILRFNPIFMIGRAFSKSGRENWGKDTIQFWSRMFWFTVWKDPRTPREILDMRNIRGASRTTLIGAKVISILFYQTVVFPVTYALLATLIQSGLDYIEGTSLSGGKDLVKWGKSEYGNPGWSWSDKWVENFMDVVPDEYSTWFDNKDFSLRDIVQGVLPFTNIDNLVYNIVDILDRETSDEDKERARERAQNTAERLQQLYADLAKAIEDGDEAAQRRIQDEIDQLTGANEDDQNNNNENSSGQNLENTTTETTIPVGGTVQGTEKGFKDWLGTEGTPCYGWDFVKFENGIGYCKESDNPERMWYLDNNQWIEY